MEPSCGCVKRDRATPWAFSPWMVLQSADDNARNALISFSNQA